jgi:restriction system protein
MRTRKPARRSPATRHALRADTARVVAACAAGAVCGAALLAQMLGLGAMRGLAAGAGTLLAAALVLSGLAATRALARRRALAHGSVAELATLTPAEFERHVADLFGHAGYDAQHVGGAGDGGVDVRVARGRRRGIVQCKRYAPRRPVGPALVREVIGTRAHERADWAWLVTTGRVTPGARRLAAAEHVALLDAETPAGWAAALRGQTFCSATPRATPTRAADRLAAVP